jgi:uncharacterized protein YecE (DUF72 family)
MEAGRIRVGIGGWDYEGWRGAFYPPGLPKARQLEHAAARLDAIEINATYYRLQTPELFASWAAATPAHFRFAVKGSRFCTNRRSLADSAEGVRRFCGQGLSVLGDRLGPIMWQFLPTKRFDRADFEAFLELLPREQDGVPLRHALEVRHESFRDPAFVELTRRSGVGIVIADSDEYPTLADLSGDFVYLRLMRTRPDCETGYPAAELGRWADLARSWAQGESPGGFAYAAAPAARAPREVYCFLIGGAKERNPAAATALKERL